MYQPDSHRNWIRLSLGALQAFIGIGGVAGGIGLISDPTGDNMGMSIEMLTASPFSDFLIPSLTLLAVNGLGSLLGAFLTVSKRPFAAEVALGLGALLVAWIMVQVYFIGLVHFLQPLYLGFGILEFTLGLLLRRTLPSPK